MSRHVKIVNRKRGWCAVEIPRCGCTGLKHLAWIDAHGAAYDDKAEGMSLHHRLGYTAAASGGLVVEWGHDTSGLYHFAVWRPPLDRLRSAWLAFTQAGAASQHESFRNIRGCTWDEWALFVRDRVLHQRADVDVHLRRQWDFYHEADVQAIVHLSRLDSFLAEKFGHEPHGRINSSLGIESPHTYISPLAGEELVRLYAIDYTIPLRRAFVPCLP